MPGAKITGTGIGTGASARQTDGMRRPALIRDQLRANNGSGRGYDEGFFGAETETQSDEEPAPKKRKGSSVAGIAVVAAAAAILFMRK
jgi:hypothetical protein